ncbi:hypothetical protein [Cryptobacterium curtum]|uniref:hypothetical protein n=1 Tax=Cryptobacterium curtum TaxID=84163 RepID=UPI0028D83C50|nr:hypothetical protein [Cryptobacterium curtum]
MGDIIGLVLTLLWGGSKVLSGCLFLPASENSTVCARGKTKKYSFVGAVRSSVAWHHLQYQVGWSLLICRPLGGLISLKESKPSLSLLNGFGSVSSSPSDIPSSCPAAFFCSELSGIYNFKLHVLSTHSKM